MPRPPNIVGQMCVKQKHFLASEDDLVASGHWKGRVSYSCKQCRREYMVSYRSTLKNAEGDPESTKMFQTGRCDRDHDIKTKDDIVVKKTVTGTRYYRCKICAQARPREQRRFIEYDCGHSMVFSPPLPWKTEPLYCVRCRDYTKVSGYGSIVDDEGEERESPQKLTWEDICLIRKLCSEGSSQRSIAERFNIASSAVSNIVNFRTWKVDPNALREDAR